MSDDWLDARLASDNPRPEAPMTEPPEIPDAGDRSASRLALKTGPDAINRAVRTAVQVALVEVVVVIVPLLLSFLDGGLEWADLWRSGVRALLAAGLAWAMRLRFPPPAPTG